MSNPTVIPSPWQTLKRTLLRSLYVLVALAILWTTWYAYAAHRLNTKLARMRALGQPASAADFVAASVPWDKNAYDLLAKSADALVLTADEKDLVYAATRPASPSLPLNKSDMATAEKMLDTHTPTIDLLRQARVAPHTIHPDPFAHYFGGGPSRLAHFRNLCQFSRVAALFHHQSRREDLAIEALLDMKTTADVVNAGPFLIDHLVGIANHTSFSLCVFHLAPDLEMQSAAAPHGITREQAKRLIALFCDEKTLSDNVVRVYQNERVFSLVMAEKADRNTLLLRPMFSLDACNSMDRYDRVLAAISSAPGNFAQTKSLLPAATTPVNSNLYRITHLYADSGSDEKLLNLHYRAVTDRRAAAARLAIRLYELDHQHKFPTTLRELVPDYLSSIPADPFRPDGGPLCYDPARRILYSYGDNCADDRGTTSPITFVVNWRSPDAVYPLDRPTPTAIGSAASAPTTPADSSPQTQPSQISPLPPPASEDPPQE